MEPLGPVVLEGAGVRLEPLREGHLDDLERAAADPGIWRWMPFQVTSRADLERWLAIALEGEASGRELPFAVIDAATGTAVGSTRYLAVDAVNRAAEIGWTWYAPDRQGTFVNPAAKLLLLAHAFDDWGAIRVFLKTDSKNSRSRAAILKLGAKYEGDLRNHMIRPDGSYRDSSYYSILPDEWPAVRRGLEERLRAPDPVRRRT